MRTRHTLIALAAGALAVPAAPAQFDIPWASIDGGVQAMTGGGYALTGTVGQHDAGPSEGPMTSFSFSLSGGFLQPPLFDPSCNLADVAEPFDLLDLSDISTFITAFLSQDPLADVAPPFGIHDLNDLVAFVTEFQNGCP